MIAARKPVGRPMVVDDVKWRAIAASLADGKTLRACAKIHGVSASTVGRYAALADQGKIQPEKLIEARRLKATDKKHASLRIFDQWREAGEPAPDMPPEWDAMLNGDAEHFVPVISGPHPSTTALVGLAKSVRAFLDGRETLRGLADALVDKAIIDAIGAEIPTSVARRRKPTKAA